LGHAPILQIPTPILSFSYQKVFLLVGVCELIIGLICFFGTKSIFQVALVSWLATCFSIYRLGLFIGHYQKPCPCLGNLTNALHIPPQTADTATKIILAYLLIGSYAIWFWLWKEKRKTAFATTSSEKPATSAS
jgi:hypothetical protein